MPRALAFFDRYLADTPVGGPGVSADAWTTMTSGWRYSIVVQHYMLNSGIHFDAATTTPNMYQRNMNDIASANDANYLVEQYGNERMDVVLERLHGYFEADASLDASDDFHSWLVHRHVAVRSSTTAPMSILMRLVPAIISRLLASDYHLAVHVTYTSFNQILYVLLMMQLGSLGVRYTAGYPSKFRLQNVVGRYHTATDVLKVERSGGRPPRRRYECQGCPV